MPIPAFHFFLLFIYQFSLHELNFSSSFFVFLFAASHDTCIFSTIFRTWIFLSAEYFHIFLGSNVWWSPSLIFLTFIWTFSLGLFQCLIGQSALFITTQGLRAVFLLRSMCYIYDHFIKLKISIQVSMDVFLRSWCRSLAKLITRLIRSSIETSVTYLKASSNICK